MCTVYRISIIQIVHILWLRKNAQNASHNKSFVNKSTMNNQVQQYFDYKSIKFMMQI